MAESVDTGGGDFVGRDKIVYQHAPPQPLDHVPHPAPLPTGSRMPLSPNPLFVGRAEDLKAQAAVEGALLAKAYRLNNAGYPAPLLAWQPHLRAVTDAAQVREDERAAGLCNEFGYHLYMIGDYPVARPHLERALAIRSK